MELKTSRRSERYQMRDFIECTTASFGGITGKVINVSEAGILLWCEGPQPVKTEALPETPIDLKVILPPSESSKKRSEEERVGMVAIPVRCEPAEDGDGYEFAFEWQRLSVPKRLMIKHWQKYCADAI